jgi:hypothetical protein
MDGEYLIKDSSGATLNVPSANQLSIVVRAISLPWAE